MLKAVKIKSLTIQKLKKSATPGQKGKEKREKICVWQDNKKKKIEDDEERIGTQSPMLGQEI